VYPERAREALDERVAAPVGVASTRLNAVGTDGSWLAPLLAALGLWIGALAAFLVLPAFLGRRDPARPWRRAVAGFGAAALLGMAQAVLMVVALALVGIDIARLPELVAVAAVAAVAFVAINQALVALFDYRGWLVSLVLLALQVAAVGAMYPATTGPELLQLLRLVLPMSFAVDAFRALVAGSGPALAPAVAGLAAWLGGSLVVTLAVAYRTSPAGGDDAEPGAEGRADDPAVAGA
jgi:putative membrane protein